MFNSLIIFLTDYSYIPRGLTSPSMPSHAFFLVESLHVSETCPRYSEAWGFGDAFNSVTHWPADWLQRHGWRQTSRWTVMPLDPLLEIPLKILATVQEQQGVSQG